MAHVREVQRKGKNAYEVRWRDGGKFKQRTFKVKREAERFALKVEDEIARGASTEVYVKRSTTVREAVEASMAAAATRLKPRTLGSYRQIYDSGILPTFGDRRLAAVTSQDVERWVTEMTTRGLAPSTVRNHWVALNKVYRYALRHRLVQVNPCTGIELPRRTGADKFVPAFLT